MRILTLDISSKMGWAVLEGDPGEDATPVIKHNGRITLQALGYENVAAVGPYPWSFLSVARLLTQEVTTLYRTYEPDKIVIEDTNESRNRYAQKLLEFIHCTVLQSFSGFQESKVVYIPVGSWRSALELKMSKEDRKNNAQVSKARKMGVAKKELGVKGRVTKKHLAIRFVADTYGIKLKVKDNDIADAICLGVAFLRGARPSEGLYGAKQRDEREPEVYTRQ